MSNTLRVILALVTSVAAIQGAGAKGTLSEKQRRANWFTPSLTTNESPVCADALRELTNWFYTRESIDAFQLRDQTAFAGLEPLSQVDLDAQELSPEQGGNSQYPEARIARSVLIGGKRVFLSHHIRPGCGGACEGEYMIGSTQPHPFIYGRPADSEAGNATPANSWYRMLRAPSQAFYVATADENDFQLLELQASGMWKTACAIQLAPPDLRSSSDEGTHTAAGELNDLLSTLGSVRGGAGSCGSMRTHARWGGAMAKAMPQVLYRPWGVSLKGQDRVAESDSPADDDLMAEDSATAENSSELDEVPGLRSWSYSGLYEHAAYARYREQLEKTISAVADFYVREDGWPRDTAERVAQQALIGAVSRGVWMGEYLTFDKAEETLRAAILGDAPLEEIKSAAAPIERSYTAKSDDAEETGSAQESILSIAVRRPDVLRYLLERGADPNRGNAFGKTPLMYAAQYNQKAAVELLLAHGADPNAATTVPEDTCFYTLETTNVTPLHYAVRYASRDLIELLVAKGAATYVRTRPLHESPKDWLKRYTAESAEERNPNLSSADAAALDDVLRVSDPGRHADL